MHARPGSARGVRPRGTETKPAGAPKGPPRGKPFEPGTNSHTGEVFRRGEDDLPRGNVTLMFKCILHDEREALYRAICRKIRRDGDYALAFLEKAGNRIEGLPVKKAEARQGSYGAVFVLSARTARRSRRRRRVSSSGPEPRRRRRSCRRKTSSFSSARTAGAARRARGREANALASPARISRLAGAGDR